MKKLILLGVYDEDAENNTRIMNNSDLEKNLLTLTFVDVSAPDQAIDLEFNLYGNYSIYSLAPALKRFRDENIPLNEDLRLLGVDGKKRVSFHEERTDFDVELERTEGNEIKKHIIGFNRSLVETDSRQDLSNQKSKPLTVVRDRLIPYYQSMRDLLKDVEQVTIKNAGWFKDRDVQKFLGRVLPLFQNLKTIELPEGVDHFLYTQFWTNIWEKELCIVKIQLPTNNDETLSTGSGTPSLHSRHNELLENDDEDHEDEDHEDEDHEDEDHENVTDMYAGQIYDPHGYFSDKNIALGVSALAFVGIVHKATNFQLMPDHVFAAANVLFKTHQKVMGAASYVPFLPSALNFAGNMAMKGAVPVAKAVGLIKSSGR